MSFIEREESVRKRIEGEQKDKIYFAKLISKEYELCDKTYKVRASRLSIPCTVTITNIKTGKVYETSPMNHIPLDEFKKLVTTDIKMEKRKRVIDDFLKDLENEKEL